MFLVEELKTVVMATNTMYGVRLDSWELPEGVKLVDFGSFMRKIKPDYSVVAYALERRGARRVGYRIGRKNLTCGDGYTFIFDNGSWYVHHSDMRKNRVISLKDILNKNYNNELYYGSLSR